MNADLLAFGAEVLAIELVLGLALVLYVGPRVTRRLIKRDTDEAWSLIAPKLRAELESVLGQVPMGDGKDAGAVEMGRRSAESRERMRAQEELVTATVLQAMGPAAGTAFLSILQTQLPSSWKLLVKQGPQAVPGFLEQMKPLLGAAGQQAQKPQAFL